MFYRIDAACGTHTGCIRKGNEDNFLFSGEYLDKDHGTMLRILRKRVWFTNGWTVSVFDGMGGENFGEYASFYAAKTLGSINMREEYRGSGGAECFQHVTDVINLAVVELQDQMKTKRMGSTMVSVSLFHDGAYVWNLGDSRAYCLRAGQLTQLSKDHVASNYAVSGRKQPLTQYLGIDPDEMQIEPTVILHKYMKNDVFLLCSDGLTDMISDLQITDIMIRYAANPAVCVQNLIDLALEKGGRDNITVIVCRII